MRDESLLRWHSAEHGEVSPAQFIPLAEESGMIVAIGEWVLREACNTLADWKRAGLPDMSIAVNVSATQLLHSDLPRTVERILRETGVDPSQLELELTESVLMAKAGLAAERLQFFRRIGVSIAVDDFGTGYSSLAYLKKLPVDELKIDKSFVKGLATDKDDAAIVRSTIDLAHNMGLKVAAEGVEEAAILEQLRSLGCDLAQGYHISRPLTASELDNWLVEQRQTTARKLVAL